MKKLFLYYSSTGNGDFVASFLKEKGYEIRKIETKKKLPKVFFFAMMSGGFQAGIGKKAQLLDFDRNLEGFDEILIGSPIWNGRTTPALNALLAELPLEGKPISFLFYSGSGEGKHAEKKIKVLFPNARIAFLKQPKKYPDELKGAFHE